MIKVDLHNCYTMNKLSVVVGNGSNLLLITKTEELQSDGCEVKGKRLTLWMPDVYP